MLGPRIRLAFLAVVSVVAAGAGLSTARAQFFHGPTPYGYGYQFGGATVLGDHARGFGQFAIGVGEFNLLTAQARAINARTDLVLHEAAREAQIRRNVEYRRFLALQQARRTHHREVIDYRLRHAPLPHDIASADALNALLADLSRPGIYLPSLRSSSATVPSATVRAVPMMYAPGGTAISLRELSQAPPPSAFRFGVINQDPVRFVSFRQELGRTQSVEVGEYVAFLRRFQLRFGPAETAEQREAYRALYPILLRMSDEVRPGSALNPVAARR